MPKLSKIPYTKTFSVEGGKELSWKWQFRVVETVIEFLTLIFENFRKIPNRKIFRVRERDLFNSTRNVFFCCELSERLTLVFYQTVVKYWFLFLVSAVQQTRWCATSQLRSWWRDNVDCRNRVFFLESTFSFFTVILRGLIRMERSTRMHENGIINLGEEINMGEMRTNFAR